ncbi:hypothetical protein Leryth_016324 [Lithospermum erythrorhizon]|nr:hypothetical protein Leryth_016324 [Lithospermum erythrorhizon]
MAERLTSLSDEDNGIPHDGLFFALGYLGVKDLLSVSRVCSSLHSAVHTDSLLWTRIHIDQPLNQRITDDLLFQLCSKAQGSLQCLRLVECLKITDDGLRRVVESNAHLTKLCVPGCTKLSIEGIINIVKDVNSRKGAQGIKTLRIGGLYGATFKHFEEVIFLLGSDNKAQERNCNPLFYSRRNYRWSCDDDRGLDIEICPMCHKPRIVYDCPAKECQEKHKRTQVCRACILCIARCVDCGRCINENAYEENFYMEVQCSYCFKDPLKSRVKLAEKSDISNGGRNHDFHNS